MRTIEPVPTVNPGAPPTFGFDVALSTAVASNGAAPSRATVPKGPLTPQMLDKIHRYWRAANYLCIGQIYLFENPLLREPLKAEQIKPRLLGHWGTSPGQNLIYVHLNRLIKEHDANIIYISGPGHGGPSLNASSYLEGTYTEVHPEITRDENGMRLLFRKFSTPGGVPSHCGPHVPNSMHEGGELGYSLVHAFGAAFDNPDLIVACVIGDGESETCPLEGSWKSNSFLNPVEDGAVLPILHLNGYKISGPTVQARTGDSDLRALYVGRGYNPHFVEGDDPQVVHQLLAAALDACYAEIRAIQHDARTHGFTSQPVWPMIVLRTPKGWTCPKEVDGIPIEGTFRAHQVPLATVRENPEHLEILETWMRSYKAHELFDERGTFIEELAELAPVGNRRMGGSPHVNGGRLLTALDLPDFTDYALEIPGPGQVVAEAPRKLGAFFGDIIRRNPTNFRDVLSRRDELQSPECRLRSDEPSLHGSNGIDRRPAEPGRTRAGSLERALLRRLARGVSAHGTTRDVVFLRSVRASRRFHDNATCQVARAVRGISLAQTLGIAQRAFNESRMAKRPQRIQPSGNRLRRQRAGTPKRNDPCVLSSRQQLPAERLRSLSA